MECCVSCIFVFLMGYTFSILQYVYIVKYFFILILTMQPGQTQLCIPFFFLSFFPRFLFLLSPLSVFMFSFSSFYLRFLFSCFSFSSFYFRFLFSFFTFSKKAKKKHFPDVYSNLFQYRLYFLYFHNQEVFFSLYNYYKAIDLFIE